MLKGSSSKRAWRAAWDGATAVKSSTKEAAGPDALLTDCAVPSVRPALNVHSSFGGSGEKDGNDVKDLSDAAIEEAELEV